jgi:UDP-N-acetylmuramate dehydrogenase
LIAPARTPHEIASALAAVAGLTFHPGLLLGRWSTFKIGGPAELAVEVASERALVRLLEEVERRRAPFHLLGLGSNVLLPDEGLPGVVARLVGELRRVRIRGLRVSAGAGAPLAQVARKASAAGLAGLEPLAGFPSTVGGAVYMNAGCYGTEIKDVLHSARIVARGGIDSAVGRRRVVTRELNPRYRATDLQGSGAIVTRALFELAPGEPKALLARMEELNAKRWASLPSGQGNAGSIFKNPPGDYAGRLIEAAGLKGTAHGGAQVSPKHANVIVNAGGAKAAEVIELMRRARSEVEARFAVRLVPEIILVGPLRDQFER